MKAPNKIFAGMAAGHLYARLTPTKLFDEEFSEYIRKNLLLEWAKEKKAELLDDEELTDVAAGINMGMDMLIHKINSL